jgi:hypothetical protein
MTVNEMIVDKMLSQMPVDNTSVDEMFLDNMTLLPNLIIITSIAHEPSGTLILLL